MKRPSAKDVYSNVNHIFAFGFGSGLARKAPGTFGTLAAIPLYLLIQDFHWAAYLGLLLMAFILGIYWCDRSSKLLGVHDHGGIVWDEFVGFWITMFLAPQNWTVVFMGFILFRFFDILKPWPINWLDRKVAGGFGIMIDDAIAGVYACVSLQLFVYFYGG